MSSQERQSSFFPKLYSEVKNVVINHILKYESLLYMFNITHEDVVCRLFPFTFEGNVANLYNIFPIGKIHSQLQFKRTFMGAFEEDYNVVEIYLKLVDMQVVANKYIRDFTTCFWYVYHHLHENYRPLVELIYHWYVHSLPETMTMFILQKGIIDLGEACEEDKSLEKELKIYYF